MQNITDLALVAGFAEKFINANSKCYQNYTFGAHADTEKESEREREKRGEREREM